MESDHRHDDLRGQWADLERGEAAPYLDHPATPRWYFPAAGVWGGAYTLVATFALTADSVGAQIGALVAMVGLAALVGAFVGWSRKRIGAWPRLQGPKPVEIARMYRRYLLGAALGLALIAVVAWQLGGWVAAAVAVVVITGGLWTYERSYARAAQSARRRLG